MAAMEEITADEIKYINKCFPCLCSKLCALATSINGVASTVNAINTKVDGISTELDLSELTNLATDSNTRIQGMQTDLATTKGNTESLSTEVGDVMARATATYNNTQAILSYVKGIDAALVVNCDTCSCDEIVTE